MADTFLDFDGNDPKVLVNNMLTLSNQHQGPREDQWAREYEAFHAFRPGKDPDRSNFRHQKVAEILMTKGPDEIQALFGGRPYFPLEAKDKDNPSSLAAANDFSDSLDSILCSANFFNEAVLAVLSKVLYGMAYTEPMPHFDMIKQKVRVPELVGGYPVNFHIEEHEQPVFTISTKAYCPWEVKVDPHAVGLETIDGARWAIICEFVSRHQMYQAARAGTTKFPNWDYDLLLKKGARGVHDKRAQNLGQQMVAALGLHLDFDDDIMLLIRCQTPYRYIDLLNGEHVLRDRDNPFNHKKINIVRWPHVPDIHTLNRFFGIGEAKPVIPMIRQLDDITNLIMDNSQFMQQPVTYYNSTAQGLDENQLVRSLANRIPIPVADDKNFDHYIKDQPGVALPSDFYIQEQRFDGLIDRRSFTPPPTRAESLPEGRTATEVAGMFESSERHNSLFTAITEKVTLKDFGDKCLHHMAQYMTPLDYAHYIGFERAMAMQFEHPNDIPNGWDFTFKGSGRMMQDAIVQRNLKELTPAMLGNPAVNPAVWAELLVDSFSDTISERDKRRLIPQPILTPIGQPAQGLPGGQTAKGTLPGSTNDTQSELEAAGAEQTRGLV